jgi:REP element-mobilizing transposase RayT
MRRYRNKGPQTIYHISSRGNRGQKIFADDPDRLRFLDLVEGMVTKLNWRCHSYCLMSNHYHLLVETDNDDLSSGIQQINSRHAQIFNVRHTMGGHLFQDRFDSSVVDSDEYFMIAASYIALNPVNAGLVNHPAEWRWSSFLQTVEGNTTVRFLESDRLLSLFADGERDANYAYAEFVQDCMEVMALSSCPLVKCEHPVVPTRPPLREIFGNQQLDRARRNALISVAYLEHGYCLKEIASFLGMSVAGTWKTLNKSKTKK